MVRTEPDSAAVGGVGDEADLSERPVSELKGPDLEYSTQDPHTCSTPLSHVVVTDETAETASWAPSGPVRVIRAGGGARPVIRSTRTGPGRRHWVRCEGRFWLGSE